MLRHSLRQTATPAVLGRQSVRHYAPHVLPAGHALALNTHIGTLAYLINEEGQPSIVQEVLMTPTEAVVLAPLLDLYPEYCPYQLTYAHFYHTDITKEVVDRCCEHLVAAQRGGTWDLEMRPVRSAVSRARLKIADFGIDILSVIGTGYMLSFDVMIKRIQEQEANVIGLHRIS